MKNLVKKLLRQNKYIEILSYILQNNKILNPSGEADFSKDVDDMYNRIKSIAELYASNYNSDLTNKVILEIGTGFTISTMLYLIKEYNLKKVYCYDRFNCLDNNNKLIIDKYNLSQYLDKIEYIEGINEILVEKINSKEIDYIVSNAVLEHVDNLPLLFSILSKLLKDNGMMFHHVDLKCHNRFKKFGELYFHTFNDKTYNLMGNKIGQPNRKLVQDYVNIFKIQHLIHDTTILEYFTEQDMNKAIKYLSLSNDDINKYNIATVEFKLYKNINYKKLNDE
jgi:hypothetical protein